MSSFHLTLPHFAWQFAFAACNCRGQARTTRKPVLQSANNCTLCHLTVRIKKQSNYSNLGICSKNQNFKVPKSISGACLLLPSLPSELRHSDAQRKYRQQKQAHRCNSNANEGEPAMEKKLFLDSLIFLFHTFLSGFYTPCPSIPPLFIYLLDTRKHVIGSWGRGEDSVRLSYDDIRCCEHRALSSYLPRAFYSFYHLKYRRASRELC